MILRACQGVRGRVFDLDTNEEVLYVIELDVDPTTHFGTLEAYYSDKNGKKKVVDGQIMTYRAKGRFKFVPTPAQKSPRIVMGALKCSKCSSELTLQGDDLCVRCRAKERNQKNKMVAKPITTPLFDCKCEKCSRVATWAVSDEVDVTPQVSQRAFRGKVGKVMYSRASTVGRRFYCAWCYQPPRLLDDKGEIIKDLNDEVVRPQF